MALGDIYEVIARGTYFAQQILNVFHYSVTVDPGSTSSALSIANALNSNILSPCTLVQSDQYAWTDVQAKNLMNVADFGDVSAPNVGAVSGDAMPSFVGWGFQLNRQLSISKNGRKTFSGVPESLVTNGDADPSAAVPLANIAVAIGQAIIVSGVHYAPIIWRRPDALHPTGTSFPVSGAIFKRVTTQNTRKIGRGI